MKKIISLLVLIVTIFIASCEKDEFIEESSFERSKYSEDTLQFNNIKVTEYKEDTIINQVGCYYPRYKN